MSDKMDVLSEKVAAILGYVNLRWEGDDFLAGRRLIGTDTTLNDPPDYEVVTDFAHDHEGIPQMLAWLKETTPENEIRVSIDMRQENPLVMVYPKYRPMPMGCGLTVAEAMAAFVVEVEKARGGQVYIPEAQAGT